MERVRDVKRIGDDIKDVKGSVRWKEMGEVIEVDKSVLTKENNIDQGTLYPEAFSEMQ